MRETVQMVVIFDPALFLDAFETAEQAFIAKRQGMLDDPFNQPLFKEALGTQTQGFPAGSHLPSRVNHQEEQAEDDHEP